jgi:hypothetical protein
MVLTVILEGISKAATVLPVLMKLYTVCYHDRGYINVMFVLQSCADPLHIPPSSSSDTYTASSDCAYHVGNVKKEKGIGSEEEECIDIKDEEDMCSEEEEEEVDIETIEEEDLDIKEGVSLEDTV